MIQKILRCQAISGCRALARGAPRTEAWLNEAALRLIIRQLHRVLKKASFGFAAGSGHRDKWAQLLKY